jgi:hypothetical protein
MGNIKQMVVQQNQAIMLTEANDYFKYLSAGLQKDKGVSITVDQSYMSSYLNHHSSKILLQLKV